MANLKASKKDIQRSERNRQRNTYYKSTVKTFVKATTQAIESGAEDAETQLRKTLRFLDKCVSKGIFHKRTIARKKSGLAQLFHAKKAVAS